MNLNLQAELNSEQLLEARNYFSDYGLVVYIDYEEHKFYIDVFAASSLGFISYQEAASLYDSGSKLYEISAYTLENLRAIFKDKIIYVDLHTEKEITLKESSKMIFGDFELDNKKDDVFLACLGDDVVNRYQEFKSNNIDTDFDDYMKKMQSDELNGPAVK